VIGGLFDCCEQMLDRFVDDRVGDASSYEGLELSVLIGTEYPPHLWKEAGNNFENLFCRDWRDGVVANENIWDFALNFTNCRLDGRYTAKRVASLEAVACKVRKPRILREHENISTSASGFQAGGKLTPVLV
jgi:hypothetical protein